MTANIRGFYPTAPGARITSAMFCMIVMLLCLPFKASLAGDRGNAHVLIISSYHDSLPWTRELMKGFRSTFRDAPLNVELHVEHMDTLRHPEPAFLDTLAAFYKDKYEHLKPSVIITTGDAALDFLLARRETLFPAIPVVFCSATRTGRRQGLGEMGITGVLSPLNIESTVELALKLHPHIRHIAVIHDKGLPGEEATFRLARISPLFQDRARLTHLTPNGLDHLTDRLRKFPRETLLLFLSFSRESPETDRGAGRQILKALTRDFNFPVYVVRKGDVGYGAVGGLVADGETSAGLAAETTLRILAGENAGGIPAAEPPPLALFDPVPLKRFGLSSSPLPEGSPLVKRPPFYSGFGKFLPLTGAFLGCLIILLGLLARDIGRRKKTEQALQEAQRQREEAESTRARELTRINRRLEREISRGKRVKNELHESEALFNSFMKHIPGRAFIKDHQGRYIYLSESYGKMLKADPASLVGMTDKEIWPRHLAGILRENDLAAMESNGAVSTVEKIPSGGGVQHHLITRFPLIREGNSKKLAAVAVDISERIKTEAERKKLASRLIQAQKIESIGTLAGGIAHDFNNLLMGIQGNVAIVEMRTKKAHPNLEKIAVIKELIASGAELTQQLLGFARGGKYDVKPVAVNDLFKKCIKMFGRTRKGLSLHGDLEKEPWTVEVDAGQMEQVLLNVLINASNAMPSGGKIHYTTRNTTLDEKFIRPHKLNPGKYVKISIRDTGIGMDEKTKVRIFDPFFTTSEMGRGTGLGLASAYGIVKSHNGFITVYSEKGKGATFNIYLPASRKRPTTAKAPPEKLVKGSGAVMLVDDEAYIREIADHILSRIGYRVITADSGKRAIELYKEKKEEIDLVILDMIMPNMGGGKTFERLKEIDPDCRILIASGYSIDKDTENLLKENRDAYIRKPFSINKLAGKISSILETPG